MAEKKKRRTVVGSVRIGVGVDNPLKSVDVVSSLDTMRLLFKADGRVVQVDMRHGDANKLIAKMLKELR